jgi:SAM-dependent methyltransferase
MGSTEHAPGTLGSSMDGDEDFYELEHWGEDRTLDAEVFRLRLEGTAELVGSVSGSWLDVGTGDGVFLTSLLPLLPHDPSLVVALDRSEAALRHVDGMSVRASATQLPFRDRCFDLVTAFEVLEHLPVEAYEATRSELGRVSRARVVVTVPNRENRTRGSVTCPVCACRYSPIRHLRSFRADRLDGLVPGFTVHQVLVFGHRAFTYPRVLRRSLERIGLLHRPGNPICPQCGATLRTQRTRSQVPGVKGTRGGRGVRGFVYRVSRRLSPRSRHRYYLGAAFRVGSES